MSVSATSPTPAVMPILGAHTSSPMTLATKVALVSILLIGSGAVRLWQARRVDEAMLRGRESPFRLADIPMTLGNWQGLETELDPQIVEATGSTDHITRRYTDRHTGVALDVIVLYGPTHDVFIHSPELCYPKAGYTKHGDSFETSVANLKEPVRFRSVAYEKGVPGHLEIQEVYFSWRYGGSWSTRSSTPKESERIPGMYKVQISRRLSPVESRERDNPCASFLEVLIPDLEARIKAPAQSPDAAKS